MKAAMPKKRPARVLSFLLTPEDSAAAPTAAELECQQTVWSWIKTWLWVAMGTVCALLIGQL